MTDMLYGMMVAEDMKFTKIGRELHEDIPLKSTEERLRRWGNSFTKQDLIVKNYMKKSTKNGLIILF